MSGPQNLVLIREIVGCGRSDIVTLINPPYNFRTNPGHPGSLLRLHMLRMLFSREETELKLLTGILPHSRSHFRSEKGKSILKKIRTE